MGYSSDDQRTTQVRDVAFFEAARAEQLAQKTLYDG